MDKVGAREALFGDEPAMEEPEPEPEPKTEFTNPWGKAEVKDGLYKLKTHNEKEEDFRELYKDYRKKSYRKSKKGKRD